MDSYSNPSAFVAKVERYLAQVNELGRGEGYITYVIKDPRGGDPRDPNDGRPIYVGQTSDLGKRARQHLRKGGAHTSGGTTISARVHQILAAGKLPIFEILERVATREASLRSETRWARHFTDVGYDLANRWAEHKDGHPADRVPAKRLWAFTLDQAYDEGIEIEVACRKCQLHAPLPIDQLAKRSRGPLPLSRIRSTLQCPNCGHSPCVRLRRSRPASTESPSRPPILAT